MIGRVKVTRVVAQQSRLELTAALTAWCSQLCMFLMLRTCRMYKQFVGPLKYQRLLGAHDFLSTRQHRACDVFAYIYQRQDNQPPPARPAPS